MAGHPAPRPTLRMAAYALAGVFGLACAIIGGSWFVAGKGAIKAGFPASLAEAFASCAGGLVVQFWAMARLKREIGRRHSPPPEGSESEEEADGES